MTRHSPPPHAPQTSAKAVVAAIVAFVGTLVIALQGRDIAHLGWQGWVTVILTTAVAGGGTHFVPNAPK